jgi:hypothetical protein
VSCAAAAWSSGGARGAVVSFAAAGGVFSSFASAVDSGLGFAGVDRSPVGG